MTLAEKPSEENRKHDVEESEQKWGAKKMAESKETHQEVQLSRSLWQRKRHLGCS